PTFQRQMTMKTQPNEIDLNSGDTQKIFDDIFNLIIYRVPFFYGGREWIKFMFTRIFCCFRRSEYGRKKDELYRIGVKKLIHEFDIANIVKQLRTMKLVSHLFLLKYQRFMLPYFKSNLLQTGPLPPEKE